MVMTETGVGEVATRDLDSSIKLMGVVEGHDGVPLVQHVYYQ